MRRSILSLLYAGLALVSAQETPTDPPPTPTSTGGGGGSSSTPPADVILHVPELSVDKIELEVDNLQADVNLAAQIANLVEINAGVQLGVENVNITIADVGAQLDLVVRLGRLAQIVNRTLSTLDLNPLLLNLIDVVTDLTGDIVGAVDGLLGSIVQGDSTINFLIDNLGNIVEEVTQGAGDAVSNIVGNYKKNMTYTGQQKQLEGGFLQRTYEYEELGAIVNVITNAADHVVRAFVVKGGGGGGDDDEEDDDGSATNTAILAATTAF